MPSPRKPDQSAPRPAGPTGATTGQSADLDPRAQVGKFLTTAQGLRLSDTDHSLKVGDRGPTLLEDFHLREKITHFDHERIPERVVHARGAAAHGVFESYGTAASVTKAGFLGKKGTKTDVFTRFSTVLGSRGSADTVRDTRGFAVKFYTAEGREATSAPRNAATLRAELAAMPGPGTATALAATHVDHIGIVVPAHNEQQRLPACLRGLVVAIHQVAIPVTVIVVLDSCTDDSAAVIDAVRATSGGLIVDTLEVGARNVGFARGAGMAEILRRHGAPGTWLATTDADSVVPPQWLSAQLNHVGAGARVVAGTVTVADWGDRSRAVRERAVTEYVAGRHRHVHGANLSFAATAFHDAGGFRPVPSDEDVTLVAAFTANAEPIAWALDLAVATSARRHSRAPQGFATYLSTLEANPRGTGPGSRGDVEG